MWDCDQRKPRYDLMYILYRTGIQMIQRFERILGRVENVNVGLQSIQGKESLHLMYDINLFRPLFSF